MSWELKSLEGVKKMPPLLNRILENILQDRICLLVTFLAELLLSKFFCHCLFIHISKVSALLLARAVSERHSET